MKIVTITRDRSTDKGTLGTLAIDGVILCQTLERPWVDANGDLISDKMVSCINIGTYRCRIVISPKFGKVYEITNVTGRDHILIHPANFVHQLQGCIALGLVRGEAEGVPCVYKSREAFNKFMELMHEEEFDLVIQ